MIGLPPYPIQMMVKYPNSKEEKLPPASKGKEQTACNKNKVRRVMDIYSSTLEAIREWLMAPVGALRRKA